MLEIINWKDDDWPTCEEQVEALVQQVIVKWSPWKEGIVSEADDRDHENDVLIEHETNQETISSVSFSSMNE